MDPKGISGDAIIEKYHQQRSTRVYPNNGSSLPIKETRTNLFSGLNNPTGYRHQTSSITLNETKNIRNK